MTIFTKIKNLLSPAPVTWERGDECYFWQEAPDGKAHAVHGYVSRTYKNGNASVYDLATKRYTRIHVKHLHK